MRLKAYIDTRVRSRVKMYRTQHMYDKEKEEIALVEINTACQDKL